MRTWSLKGKGNFSKRLIEIKWSPWVPIADMLLLRVWTLITQQRLCGGSPYKTTPLSLYQNARFKEHGVSSFFDNCEKISRCKELLLFKVKSLQTSPQWDSGKMWFKNSLSLAKPMTLLPRSPTIKWVNDWIKLLMVGWARWPLRSCQVSISENQEFYQSNTHGALCWIWPQRKAEKSTKNVSLFVSIFISVLSPHFPSLLPGSHHSQGYL